MEKTYSKICSCVSRPTTTAVEIVFSEEVDPRTIDPSNLTLRDGSTTVAAAVLLEDDLTLL